MTKSHPSPSECIEGHYTLFKLRGQVCTPSFEDASWINKDRRGGGGDWRGAKVKMTRVDH